MTPAQVLDQVKAKISPEAKLLVIRLEPGMNAVVLSQANCSKEDIGRFADGLMNMHIRSGG